MAEDEKGEGTSNLISCSFNRLLTGDAEFVTNDLFLKIVGPVKVAFILSVKEHILF